MTLTELRELRKKATKAVELARGTSDLSFERADAFGIVSHYREKLAEWFDLPSTQAMLDQAESNARDAERYRWLRDEIARGDVPRSYMPHWMDKIAYPADFDSAIDAARREGDENG